MKNMKNMMKALLATVVVALLAGPILSARQEARPDFSGTWALDLTKSDFGQVPPPQSVVITIDHKDPVIKSTATQKGAEGEFTSTSTITTDGKESLNKVATPGGEMPTKSVTKWSGRNLVTVGSMDMQGMTLNVNDTWELSPDGKTLTSSREVITDQGTFPLRLVFNKQ